jgi:hypothetical protein
MVVEMAHENALIRSGSVFGDVFTYAPIIYIPYIFLVELWIFPMMALSVYVYA